MTETRLMTPTEVADYLQIPLKSLYQWRYRGLGPPAIRVGRHLRYPEDQVAAWLEQIRADEARVRAVTRRGRV